MKQVIIIGHNRTTKAKCGFIFLVADTLTNPLQAIHDVYDLSNVVIEDIKYPEMFVSTYCIQANGILPIRNSSNNQ